MLDEEVILAQEQGVINRGVGLLSGIEGAFEEKETEGTLVLTNKRIIYARGDTSEKIDIDVTGIRGGLSPGWKSIVYLDVDDLSDIKSDPANLSIEFERLSAVKGIKRMAQSPKLEIEWNDGQKKRTEFIQEVTGKSRRKNLNDWAVVIERLRQGKQKIVDLPLPPEADTLEGRILRLLSDYEERGPLTIELELEKRYNAELELDEVQAACDKLVSTGLVSKTVPPGEEAYYAKVSPLGRDNLEA